MTSCSSDNDDEKGVETKTLTFEGSSWGKLIDNPQYGGSLIYSEAQYSWLDSETHLSSGCKKEDWSEWDMGWGWQNGIVISNYVDATANSRDKHLSVPVTNGSSNFAVVWDDGSALSFADNKEHLIKSMQVINTSYALSNINSNKGTGYFFTITATGKNLNGNTKTVTFDLARDNDAVSQWKTIDLSALGTVVSVIFSFDGSDKGEWGVNTPKYFAFDNVVVEM